MDVGPGITAEFPFIVIEAGKVDVLRPAMPNVPEALIATWGQAGFSSSWAERPRLGGGRWRCPQTTRHQRSLSGSRPGRSGGRAAGDPRERHPRCHITCRPAG